MALRAGKHSTHLSSEWPLLPMGVGIGSSGSDGGIYSFGDANVLRIRGRSIASISHRSHGEQPSGNRLLAGEQNRCCVCIRECGILRGNQPRSPSQADCGHRSES